MKYLMILAMVIQVNGIGAMEDGRLKEVKEVDKELKAARIRNFKNFIEAGKAPSQEREDEVRAVHELEKEVVSKPKSPFSRKKPVRVATSSYDFDDTAMATVEAFTVYNESSNREFIEKLTVQYQKALDITTQHHIMRDGRLAEILDKQAGTILQLSTMIKRLMKIESNIAKRMGAAEEHLTDFHDDTDANVGNLLTAVTDQSEMFVRQNAIIRELMARVEAMNKRTIVAETTLLEHDFAYEKLAQAAKEFKRKQSVQAIKIESVRKMIVELSEERTMEKVDELYDYFTRELAAKELPVVQEKEDDTAFMQYVLSNSSDKQKEEADSSSGEIVSDITIIEDI